MAQPEARRILNRPVDTGRDHVLGAPQAPLTLVEYGSYACPHCRAANEQIAGVRDRFGGRLRYVFRHRPLTGRELARRSQLVRDLPAAFELLKNKYASNYPSMISFITGPSRTGDIERILVLGAHGPKKLTIFLCED